MGTHRVWNQIYFPNFFAQSSPRLHLLDKYFPLHWEQIEFPNPPKRIPVSTSSKKTVLRTWVLKTRQFEKKKEPKIPFYPIFKKLQDNSKRPFFSLFLMRKPLSSGQKLFLRLYFPLIRGMLLLKCGLRFSFRALEVPEPRVRKRPLSLLIWPFPHSRFGHFPCLKRKSKTTSQ